MLTPDWLYHVNKVVFLFSTQPLLQIKPCNKEIYRN